MSPWVRGPGREKLRSYEVQTAAADSWGQLETAGTAGSERSLLCSAAVPVQAADQRYLIKLRQTWRRVSRGWTGLTANKLN